jgi:hypothetical protein
MEQLTGGPWVELYEVCPECKGMGGGRPPGGGMAEACPTCGEKRTIPRRITLPELAKMLRKAK